MESIARMKSIFYLWLEILDAVLAIETPKVAVMLQNKEVLFLRASSYEAGQPGWLGFRDLALPLFPS